MKLKFILIVCLLCLMQGAFAINHSIDNTYSNNVDNDDVTSTEGAVTDVPVSSKSRDAIGNMLLQSVSLMGIPYKWGGNTPQTGMDCSGFIRYVFQKSLGITLPRTAAQMAKVGKRVSLDDLEPGDLLFFNTRRGSNTHVGMYIGNNKFIQSPHTGSSIMITTLDNSWRSKINGAKRIIQEDDNDNGTTTVLDYQDITDEGLPVHYFRSKHHARYRYKHHARRITHYNKRHHHSHTRHHKHHE